MPQNNGQFGEVRVLIFDLDGTLIDSKLDLALSVNAMLEHFGRPPLGHETIYGFVGNGAPMLVRRALGPNVTEAEAESGLDFFRKYYRAHMLDHTVPYPGVREGLEMLSGYSMAVLTNKPVKFSQAIIEGLGLAPYFEFVYGEFSFERKKPDPMGVETLLRDFHASPREAMIVGDSEVDILTARNAGTWACGVTYGLGSARLPDLKPDLLLDSLTQLSAHLRVQDSHP